MQLRKLHIQSFGCQMNDYDVERMTEVLQGVGYELTAQEQDADVIILNSCAIREKAEHKVVSAVGRFRALKQQRPEVLLAVGGCVPTLEGESLLDTVPLVDFTFGPDAIASLPALIDEVRQTQRRFAAVAFTDIEQYEFLDANPKPSTTRITGLVTIQKGCDNDCAYCVVPNTRGAEISRAAAEVVAETQRFVAAGAREITLIGQNVNSYHGAADGFVGLLRQVDAVPGLARLRFTTSHPKDFGNDVAECFRDLPRLCEWLHLPVQAGSTRVLHAMRRTYTREDYLRKIDHLRDVCPDISLSTDIIVGYPGESDEEFRETLSLLEYVQYDAIYSFKYSPRPRTPAITLGDTISESLKSERLQAVQDLQRTISARRLQRFVGSKREVLVEGESRYGGQACGRIRQNHKVNFSLLPSGTSRDAIATDAMPPTSTAIDQLMGCLVEVEIVSARAHSLEGRLSEDCPPIAAASLTSTPRRSRTSLPVVA